MQNQYDVEEVKFVEDTHEEDIIDNEEKCQQRLSVRQKPKLQSFTKWKKRQRKRRINQHCVIKCIEGDKEDEDEKKRGM